MIITFIAAMTNLWKSKPMELFNCNVCRLCAKICDNLLPIFSNSEKDRIDIKIRKCLPKIEVCSFRVVNNQIVLVFCYCATLTSKIKKTRLARL